MTRNPHKQLGPRVTCAILLLASLAVAFAIYWPGFSGTFLLDDFPNLRDLSRLSHPGAGLNAWLNFVFGNSSGPLGRPLAMFSFALQHAAWPTNPPAFKQANFLLHAVNAGLVYWLAIGLLRQARAPAVFATALFIAVFWLLLPIHVSTVLYIVQRMTILSATFVFLGLAIYVHARSHGSTRAAWVALVALVTSGALAALSKETGVLILPLAIVLEWVLQARNPASKDWRRHIWPALALAAAGALAAMVWMLPRLLGGYAKRDFTLLERVLTQGHVLVDYMKAVVAPSQLQLSVFHDDFPVISSVGQALPWYLIIAGLLAAAVALRRRLPLVSLGILIFFTGHTLESSIFPLELYFEHRNYLPSLGIVLGVAGIGQALLVRLPVRRIGLIAPLAAGLLLTPYVLQTAAASQLWSRPLQQATVWAILNPESMRARMLVISRYLERGQIDIGEKLLEEARADFPRVPHFDYYAIASACHSTTMQLPDRKRVVEKTVDSNMYAGLFEMLDQLIGPATRGECENLEPTWLRALLGEWLEAEDEAGVQRKLLGRLARLNYLTGDLESALYAIDLAARIHDNGELRLRQAEWFIEAGHYEKARQALRLAEEAMKRSGWRGEARLERLYRQLDTASGINNQNKIEDND